MSTKKRKKVIGIIGIVAVLIAAIYFFVPRMLADEVYPLKYADLIVKYSTKYDVDPALVCAVILQESRFNPAAKNSSGAQGLMQFMPGTASTMAKETGHWPKYDIFDAETSIEFGAAHIHDLLVKYNGNIDQALAGYNAGTGTVDGWIRQGIFQKVISSGANTETIKYVARVKNYQSVYTSMYGKDLGLVTNINIEANKQSSQSQVRGFVWVQIFRNVFSL